MLRRRWTRSFRSCTSIRTSSQLVPRRLGCRVQDDQCHAARPRSRQRVVPPQDRRSVPPDPQHQGRGSAIGLGSMETRAHALESDLAALRNVRTSRAMTSCRCSQVRRPRVALAVGSRNGHEAREFPRQLRAQARAGCRWCLASSSGDTASRKGLRSPMPWPPKPRCSVRPAKVSSRRPSSSRIASPTTMARRSS